MLPLKTTTREAVSGTLGLSEASNKERQIPINEKVFALAARARNVAPDGLENIHRALAILRADLEVVIENIQALELIAAEGRTEVTAPMRKPRKVVDIHTKRA